MAELPILTSRSLIIHLAPIHLAWTLVAGSGRRDDCSASITEVRILQVQRVERCDASAFEGQFNSYVIALSVKMQKKKLASKAFNFQSAHLLLATKRTRPVSVCPCFTNKGFWSKQRTWYLKTKRKNEDKNKRKSPIKLIRMSHFLTDNIDLEDFYFLQGYGNW